MASSCDCVVPLITDQMQAGTEVAQMGLWGDDGETGEVAHKSCIIDQPGGEFLHRSMNGYKPC